MPFASRKAPSASYVVAARKLEVGQIEPREALD